MTSATASTRVFQRMDLIVLQFKIAFRRCVPGVASARLAQLETGLTQGLIRRVHIYGLDSQEMCYAELILSVDWREYDRQIAQGRVTVTIDERWDNNTAIEIDELVLAFTSFVNQRGLSINWAWGLSDEVLADSQRYSQVCNQLNLDERTYDPKRAPNQAHLDVTVPELPEFGIGLRRGQ